MSLRAQLRRLYIKSQTVLGIDALNRRRLSRGAEPTVRIVLGHGTPAASADAFRRQIDWVARHFDLIDFERFKQLWQLSAPLLQRPAAMFTFDDGMANNFEIGAPLLEEFGTRGLFFVVPEFSLSPDSDSARRYFSQRLRGGADVDHRPMTPAQIAELAQRGHTIGNHTMTHARLSETPESELTREIVDSAAMIESWTGKPVEAFAWTFYWNAITPAAFRLAAARHPYCFTPCPGLVRVGVDSPALLWRTNVEAAATPDIVRFMFGGLADRVWSSRRRKLAGDLLVRTAGSGR